MTVGEALEIVKYTNETMLPDSLLCRWLAEHDGRVLQEDYLRNDIDVMYDPEEDLDAELLIQAPWDGMYISWIQQKIHFSRGEYQDAADCRNDWDTMHGEWVRHMLNTTPTDCCGKPILHRHQPTVRQGSDGVVHLHTIFDRHEVASLEAWLKQGEMSFKMTDEDMEIIKERYEITLRLSGQATALLQPGTVQMITVIHTTAGERYESDMVKIWVLKTRVPEGG